MLHKLSSYTPLSPQGNEGAGGGDGKGQLLSRRSSSGERSFHLSDTVALSKASDNICSSACAAYRYTPFAMTRLDASVSHTTVLDIDASTTTSDA